MRVVFSVGVNSIWRNKMFIEKNLRFGNVANVEIDTSELNAHERSLLIPFITFSSEYCYVNVKDPKTGRFIEFSSEPNFQQLIDALYNAYSQASVMYEKYTINDKKKYPKTAIYIAGN